MAATSALIIPVFIWHAPPSHNVTASYFSLDHNRFISGSDKGHIVLWNSFLKSENKIFEPQVICFTEEAKPISAFEIAPYNERECLISVSSSGSVSIWSLTDGQCQVTRSNAFKCSPTSLKLLPDRQHIAASGHSPAVEILDLLTLRVVRRFSPHSDWLCFIDWSMMSQQAMLVSVSFDNYLRLWTLNETDYLKSSDASTHSRENVRDEHLALTTMPLTDSESRFLPGKPRSGSVSPSGHSLMIVHEDFVKVFSMSSTRQVWEITNKHKILHASWCDDLTILVWTKKGRGYLHRLPKSTLPVTSQSQGNQSYSGILFGNHNQQLGASLTSDTTTDSLAPSSHSQTLFTRRTHNRASGIISDIFKLPSSWKPGPSTDPKATMICELMIPEAVASTLAVTEIQAGSVDNFAYLIHGNGQVIIWMIPIVFDKENLHSQILPIKESRLSDGWNTQTGGFFGSQTSIPHTKPFNSNTIQNPSLESFASESIPKTLQTTEDGIDIATSTSQLNQSQQSNMTTTTTSSKTTTLYNTPKSTHSDVFVTASMILEKRLQLISGFSNGTISLSKLPLDLSPRSWRAHKSRINALLLMPCDNKEYLVTGSSDFYIKVWDIETEPATLVHTFANHCGPVRSLFAPDPTEIKRRGWKQRFFSIGEDRIVGLFGIDRAPHCVRVFPNHPSSISEVRWKPDEDYLLVQCRDGSVTVWEMESGTQETSSVGREAKSMMSFAKPLSKALQGTSLKPVSRQSITGVSIPIEGESPVQAVLLNIKYLSLDLAEHLQAFVSYRSAHSHRSKDKDSVVGMVHGVSGMSSHNLMARSGHQDDVLNRATTIHKIGGTNATQTDTTASSTVLPSGATITSKMSLSMSAVQLGSYRACTYLLPWGLDPDLDQLVIAQLYLKPPKPPVSYGTLGVDGSMSVLVPRSSELAGRYQCSDSLTAIHSVASMAISKSLLSYDVTETLYLLEQRNASSHLMSYFCVLLPEKVSGYINPSLTVLAAFWQDPVEEILQGARAVFASVLSRLSHEQRRILAIAWGNLLKKNTTISSATNTPTKVDKSEVARYLNSPTAIYLRNQSVLVLSILGCEYPESLPTELAANVALELLEITFESSNSRMRIAAAELFGKGFPLWSQHLHEEASTLIHKLFKLAMVPEPKNLSKTAARALMLIGARIPGRFTQAISQRFTDLIKSGGNSQQATSISSSSVLSSPTPATGYNQGLNSLSSSGSHFGSMSDSGSPTPSSPSTVTPANSYAQSLKEHAKVLVILARLVKAHPLDFYPELPTLVDAIVKALHPHIPGLRDATLTIGTSLLNMLVGLFPMLAMDLSEQKLAVGTRDGQVFMYDLNTATRIHSLQCHAPFSVSAVAFAGANKVLSTYSVETGQLKVWKTTQSLFGILSGEPQNVKTFEVPSSIPIQPQSISGNEPSAKLVKSKYLAQDPKKTPSKTPAPGNQPPSESQGPVEIVTSNIILERLRLSWSNPKLMVVDRAWEDTSMSHLQFPI